MQANEQVPTRSAMLQLREEQSIIHEAYDFLDEKRLLLAAESLRQLNQYQKLLDEYEKLRQRAEQALVATVRRHGLQGTQVYPGYDLEHAELDMTNSLFMGVNLMKTKLKIPEAQKLAEVCQPSPEAKQCGHFFLQMVKLAAIIAGVSGNLHRLLAEYRRTERRARALENVVIPEIARKLRNMSTRLEELEQEDIVRVHLKY